MSNTKTFQTLLLCGLWALAGLASAADRPDQGKREYQNNCASCHGAAGKGDGPMRSAMLKPPTDLTVLTQKNGGVFPMERVQQVIDGRSDIKSHGSREMPVWGNRYINQGKDYYIDVPFDTEAYVSTRILLLADYLNRLQVK